jgi:hypothetical protein
MVMPPAWMPVTVGKLRAPPYSLPWADPGSTPTGVPAATQTELVPLPGGTIPISARPAAFEVQQGRSDKDGYQGTSEQERPEGYLEP